MPKTKKKKAKGGRTRKPAGRSAARKTGRRTAARPRARAAGSAGNRRIAELEAENQRLREEIAALRGEREGEGTGEGPPALEL